MSDSVYALLAGQLGGWLKQSQMFQQRQRYFSGLVYLALGVGTAVSGSKGQVTHLMAYRFVTDREDYRDLASGQVLLSAPGQPAFPVRLVSEIFQRARALLGNPATVSLYDPCCGSGYHLAVLGFLHREALSNLTASDIAHSAAQLATRNLSLLTPEGLNERRQAIATDWQAFGKASHQAALASANRLMAHLAEAPAVPTRVFVTDATQPGQIAAHLDHPV